MAISTENNVVLSIGTTAETPASLPSSSLYYNTETQTLSVYANGALTPVNPTFTSVASIAALKAITAANRYSGLVVLITASTASQQQLWYFNSTSALTGDDILVIAPTAGTGRWLRVPGAIDLALPFTFSTADAAILLTVPTGARLNLRQAYWEVLSALTGASGGAAAIGLSSSNMTGITAKGAVLGGASGDLLAVLVTGVTSGTIGSGLDTVAKLHTNVLLIPGTTLRFDRVANQFTAGTGYVHAVADLVLNAGA